MVEVSIPWRAGACPSSSASFNHGNVIGYASSPVRHGFTSADIIDHNKTPSDAFIEVRPYSTDVSDWCNKRAMRLEAD